MSTETIYVPGSFLKARQTNFGEVIGLDIRIDKEFAEFVKANKNDRGFLRLEIVPRKTPDEKNTHSLKVNNWVPTPQEGTAPKKAAVAKKAVTKKVAPQVEEEEPELAAAAGGDDDDVF